MIGDGIAPLTIFPEGKVVMPQLPDDIRPYQIQKPSLKNRKKNKA